MAGMAGPALKDLSAPAGWPSTTLKVGTLRPTNEKVLYVVDTE